MAQAVTRGAWSVKYLVSGVVLLAAACGDRGSAEPSQGGIAAPPAVAAADLDRIVAAFNRGIALMEQYRPIEAVAAFESVVALAPDWSLGRLNLGIALLNAESDEAHARAETELRRVAAEVPDDPHAHYALGMLDRHLTRFAAAREAFARVLEIDPDDPDAHYQLGILVADEDEAAARAHFERTLARLPHHESACYRLQSLLRRAGETGRAEELMVRFAALKTAKAGVSVGMKYGEMGRYAELVRRFANAREPDRPPGSMPRFDDVAAAVGLIDPGSGGGSTTPGSATFGPGIAIADVDADGALDLYVTASGAEGGAFWRQAEGRFTKQVDCGIDGRDAIGAWFGDYDADGDPDLYLTCAGPNRLYRNDGALRFTDVTAASGTAGGSQLSVGAVWVDLDHDGDLDLYVANRAEWRDGTAAQGGAPNQFLRNDGDGRFTDVAAECGIDCGDAASLGVQLFDLDDDRDLDFCVVNADRPLLVFRNDRVGRFADATALFPGLSDAGPGTSTAVADCDGNGLEDLLVLFGESSPRLWLQAEPGQFVEDQSFAASARAVGGALGGAFADLDLDGDFDLVLTGAGAGDRIGTHIALDLGGGRFAPPELVGPPGRSRDARGFAATDLDGDGAVDLLIARSGAALRLWRGTVPPGARWLCVVPAGSPTPLAIGLQVEVKTGSSVQTARIGAASSALCSLPARLHFGLGAHGTADYVRLLWPDAVLQSEMEVAGGQTWRVQKVVRKPSSCPVLFAWDGERFAFITDFLGTGGVGFFVSPRVYAPPDPTEDVRIPPELVAPRDGRYLLRVAEPLEEVSYLDQLELRVYDHPAAIEVHPDERFAGAEPFPTGEPVAIAQKVFPVAARASHRGSVLDELVAIDRRCVEPPVRPRFPGYAEDHWVELDFGDRLRGLPAGGRLWLCLHGWAEYTYSHVNYAAWQAGLAMQAPSLEVPDGRGGWRVARADAGFPAGLPRTMTIDLTGIELGDDARLRLRTNMQIHWDHAFAGVASEDVVPTRHVLIPSVAELRFLGYPREYSPDGREPTLYDYARVDPSAPFKAMSGDFTRYGDVRELLAAADDRCVVMSRGDEIALEFDAAALAVLPPGWTRTVVLHADGWCKDMDLYTAFPDTVEPLPFHGMTNYPPPATTGPTEAKRDEVLRRFNTRRHEGR